MILWSINARMRARAHLCLNTFMCTLLSCAPHLLQDACFRAIELMEQTLLASKDKSSTTGNRLTSAAATSVRLAGVCCVHAQAHVTMCAGLLGL